MTRLRGTRMRLLAVALVFAFACKNFESYVPHLVTIGGAVLQVTALNYVDPNYHLAVNVLMGSLTPAAAGMAMTWAQEHKRQKELAELERIEQEIRAEQAELEKARASAADVIGKSVPPQSTKPLAVDIALLRVRGAEPPAPIRDGDTLHDGRDGNAPADGFRVVVRPLRDAHVYVVAIDAVGRVQTLYSSASDGAIAPLPAKTALQLPGPGDAYGLDAYRGVQHVIVYASESPNTALEVQLRRFARTPAPEPNAEKVYVVSEPTLIEAGPGSAVTARGLTNVRPLTSVPLTGGGGEIEAERVNAPAGQSLVVTRWFEHQ